MTQYEERESLEGGGRVRPAGDQLDALRGLVHTQIRFCFPNLEVGEQMIKWSNLHPHISALRFPFCIGCYGNEDGVSTYSGNLGRFQNCDIPNLDHRGLRNRDVMHEQHTAKSALPPLYFYTSWVNEQHLFFNEPGDRQQFQIHSTTIQSRAQILWPRLKVHTDWSLTIK